MLRVGFIGVPGCGKTSTARLVAAICRRCPSLKRVELIDEYARWYINTYGPTETIWEQVRILNKQLSREGKVPAATTDLLITDSPVFMSLAYALDLRRPGNRKDVMVVSDLFKMMSKLNTVPHYDLVVHIPPVLKPVNDGTRAVHQFEDGWRKHMDHRIQAMFDIFPPRLLIHLKATDLEGRAQEVLEAMELIRRKDEGPPEISRQANVIPVNKLKLIVTPPARTGQ